MKPHRSHAGFALLVVMIGGCGRSGSPADRSLGEERLTGAGVLLTTDRTSYQQGTSVELTIQNHEPARLGYNACTRVLELRDGTSWIPAPASLRLCSREVWYVQAGEIRSAATDLDLGLPRGEYRIVLSFAADEASPEEAIQATSNSFTITP